MKGGAGESTCRGEFSSQQAAQNHLELQLQMTCCPTKQRDVEGCLPLSLTYQLTLRPRVVQVLTSICEIKQKTHSSFV